MCTLKVLSAGRVALLQLLDDVRLAGGRQERRQPVVVLDDLVRDDARRDLARPADHLRNAERALPVRVLLAPERRHSRVRPGVHVRPVVGAVDDDRVLGDAELVEHVEQLRRRSCRGRSSCRGTATASGPAWPRLSGFGCVRKCMCVVLTQHEERRSAVVLALDEVHRAASSELVVDGLHALLGQRPGVLDLLLADAAPARSARSRRPHRSPSSACTPRGPKRSRNLRKVRRRRVVGQPPAPLRR